MRVTRSFLYKCKRRRFNKKWSSIANKFSYQAQFDFKNDISVLIDEIANDSDLCQEINALFDSKLVNVKMK